MFEKTKQQVAETLLEELQMLCYRIGTDASLPDKFCIRDLKDALKDAEAALEMLDDQS